MSSIGQDLSFAEDHKPEPFYYWLINKWIWNGQMPWVSCLPKVGTLKSRRNAPPISLDQDMLPKDPGVHTQEQAWEEMLKGTVQACLAGSGVPAGPRDHILWLKTPRTVLFNSK